MARRRRLFRGLLLLLAALPVSRAHDEWNNLHIVYSAKTEFVYPFDGRTPKVAIALMNHYRTPSPEVAVTLAVNGQPPGAAGFTTFPDGGYLVVGADNFHLATAFTAGIHDGRAGAVPPPGQPHAPRPTYVESAKVRFTHLGDTPSLAGPMSFRATGRALGSLGMLPEGAIGIGPITPVTIEVSSTHLGTGQELDGTLAPEPTTIVNQGLLARRLAPAVQRVGPRDARHSARSSERSASAARPRAQRRGPVRRLLPPRGRGRDAETWQPTATNAEAVALRAAGRIYKYKFDGTKLWEHAPGWETWGADMAPDGRFVAYVLHPAAHPFRTPTEHKLVLLDGATGAVLWTKSAPPSDPAVGRKLESVELALSPDARWLAVGSLGGGAVTLIDRASGAFAWTVPGSGPSFGQVRRLRFSPDSQFLYCGSGDSLLRKLRVADGAEQWKVFAGGWPVVSSLDLTPEGTWLAAGTNSLDATLIRTSDGRTEWQKETQQRGALFAPDGRHVATDGGQIYRTLDGSLAGMTKSPGLTRFTSDGRHVLQFDRELRLHDFGGKLMRTFEPTGLAATARNGRTSRATAATRSCSRAT